MDERKNPPDGSEPTYPGQTGGQNQASWPGGEPVPGAHQNNLSQKNNEKIKKLESLSKARMRQPENRQLKAAVYEELKQVLEQDPFLAYQDENEAVYEVVDQAQDVLIVPKERAVPEPFPVNRPEPIRKAYRFLLWAALGLFLSGLGSLIFAPAAGIYAFRAFGETGPKDQIRARVVITLSALVFALGIGLAYLFWLHVAG